MPEELGIEATREFVHALGNTITMARDIGEDGKVDGRDLSRILGGLADLVTLGKSIGPTIKEASDYSPAELQEIGTLVVSEILRQLDRPTPLVP